MSEDAAFLQGIQADPRDWSLRLVYADWLEEQGDFRGELIRIEDEMRLLPVFGDRFWDLKPRRNELRAQAAPEWLELMGYGTVCQPVFRHGWPDGVKERWRLIREFVERWRRVPMPDVGGRLDEIREVESRLGLALPHSLRECVAFAHDRGNWHFTMRMIDEDRVISLILDGDCEWVIRLLDLDLPDPPMYALSIEGRSIADRLTSLVFGSVFYGLVYSRVKGGQFETRVVDPDPLIRELERWFPSRCRIEATNLRFQNEDIRLYEIEDILVALTWETLGNRVFHRMHALFSRPLLDEAIPPFFWDYARDSERVHGPFGRGKDLPGFWDPENRSDIEDDDIPF